MNIIRFLCRLNCASWLPCLRSYVSELGCDIGFELGLSDVMVMGAPAGYLLVYSINMFLGLKLGNYFGTREGYLVGVSLVTLNGLMIVTGEGSLFGLPLGLPIVSPIESPNNGSDLTGTLLGAPLGLRFGSEAVRCLCF